MDAHNRETRKLLAHIAARLGGVERCAAKLGIGPTALNQYITGQRLVPDKLVLQVIDLILDGMEETSAGAPGQRNGRADAPVPDQPTPPAQRPN